MVSSAQVARYTDRPLEYKGQAMIDVTCFNWIKLVQKSKLPSQAKYLAHYLSTYMNQNQDVAWPSQSRIKGETGLSHSTVLKYLNVLEESNWLIRERGNSTTNTRYLINVPMDTALDTIGLGGRSRDNLRRSTDDLGVGRETTTNNNINNKRIKKGIPFDEFWILYPRKTAKKAAEKSWCKLEEEDQKSAITYLTKKPFANELPKYIPHPSTFLNGERWNDELTTEQQQGTNYFR